MNPEITVFKPLRESDVRIPETFENLRTVSLNDREIQKTPAVWFTRNGESARYNPATRALEIGKEPVGFLFRGSVEVTVPKGYFTGKQGIELIYRGRGWLSIKLMESTRTPGGVQTEFGGRWKKLDTVREAQIFSLGMRAYHTRRIPMECFYNKPFNVSVGAFIAGFRKLDRSRIASLEITARFGCFEIQRVRAY